MAIATGDTLLPLDVAVLSLKKILEDFGIAPIILRHWKINIEENPVQWRYDITLSWRTYRIRKYIDKDELALRNNQTDALFQIGRLIAKDLWVLNDAKDEKHMEALVLMAQRPTNAPHHQQL